MDRLVIDASVALAWVFEDEPSAVADAVFGFLDSGAATSTGVTIFSPPGS